jgi:hypothetical protein
LKKKYAIANLVLKLHDKYKKDFLKILSPILPFIVLIAAVLSCAKGGTANEKPDGPHVINFKDTVFPVVTIVKPVLNRVFTTGDTIKIEGTVTDTSIYRGKLKIVNDANGAVVKEQEYEIHGLPLYNFNLTHKTFVNIASNYTVIAEWEDHGFNITVKSVKVKVNL